MVSGNVVEPELSVTFVCLILLLLPIKRHLLLQVIDPKRKRKRGIITRE